MRGSHPLEEISINSLAPAESDLTGLSIEASVATTALSETGERALRTRSFSGLLVLMALVVALLNWWLTARASRIDPHGL